MLWNGAVEKEKVCCPPYSRTFAFSRSCLVRVAMVTDKRKLLSVKLSLSSNCFLFICFLHLLLTFLTLLDPEKPMPVNSNCYFC